MTRKDTGYRFLPSVRHGLQPAESYSSGTVASIHGSVPVDLGVDARDPGGGAGKGVAGMTVRLYGPGDVKGIDQRQVVRCEPSDGTTDYPPNYFPHVEFDNPGLPWLFSPEKANPKKHWKVRPWLSLVVVEKRDDVAIEQDLGGPLPQLTVDDASDQLPPPSETWAWAHAQVVGEFEDLGHGTVQNELSGRSDATVSRLVAPRNLAENTSYYACVVPTFVAGRRAGLGQEPTPTEGDGSSGSGGEGVTPGDVAWKAAWNTGDPIQLPVYYHWEFATGPTGDFESLVRALEPTGLGQDVGSRKVDLSDPGVDALADTRLFGTTEDEEDDSAALRLSGALQPVNFTTDSYLLLDDLEDDDGEYYLHERLRELLNYIGGADEPVVGPPLYGRWHADRNEILGGPVRVDAEDLTHNEDWHRWLNLDLLKRLPASFGTSAIQDNQEALMAEAWNQFGELKTGNELVKATQVARAVGESTRKQIPTTLGEFLSITTPMHSHLEWRGSELTLHGRLRESPMPRGATGPAFRRIVRPRGPLSRGLEVTPDVTNMMERLSTGERLRVTQPRAGERVGGADGTYEGLLDFAGGTDRGVVDVARMFGLHEGAGIDQEMGGGIFSEYLEDDGDSSRRTDGGRDGDPGTQSEDDEGPSLAAEALARLDSVDDHCETARDRLRALETAIQGRVPAEHVDADLPEEAVRRISFERPTVAQHCASIGGSTFGPLNRSLTRLLVEAPDNAPGLSMDRKDDLVARMHSIQGDLVETVEETTELVREAEEEPADVLDGVGRAIQHLDQLIDLAETLRNAIVVESTVMAYTSERIDPGERTVEMNVLDADTMPTVEELIPVEDSLVELLSERLGVDSNWLRGGDGVGPRKDPLEEIMAAPEFHRAMYKPLRDLSPQYVMPGIEHLPKDTVGLLETNQRFVEAYMVGCSHEMARELHWRRYPTDRRGTYFRHFWDRSGATAPDTEPPADISEIHTWTNGTEDPLGAHSPAAEEAKLVLIVRGELLNRYPNTRIYAAKAVKERDEDEDEFDRVPLLEQQYDEYSSDLEETTELPTHLGGYTDSDLDGWEVKEPIFRGTLTDDVTFFGFDLTDEEAVFETRKGPLTWDDIKEKGLDEDLVHEMGWFFVFEEEPHGPRFGLDKASDEDYEDPPFGISHGSGDDRRIRKMGAKKYNDGAEAGWDGLSWGHMVSSADDLDEKQHVEVTGDRPWGDGHPWSVDAPETESDGDAHEQWTKGDAPEETWEQSDAATWGDNSAHMARITWQRPVRVAVHADDMLTENKIETLRKELREEDSGE